MELKRVGLVSLHTSPLETPGSADAGGLNVYVVALAEQLAALGYEPELITRAASPEHPQTGYTEAGVPVRFLQAGPREPVPKADLARHMYAFRDALRELPRFDILHSHYWLSGAAALAVAEQQGVPHIQSLHTVAALKNAHLAPGDRPEPVERLWGEQRLVQESAFTISSTVEEKTAVVESYGADPDRVLVIPPGVDRSLFHPAQGFGAAGGSIPGGSAPGGSAPDAQPLGGRAARTARPGILTLGRIQPLKGQDLAIRALATIPAERRPLLTIAGAPTPGEKKFERSLHTLVDDLGLGGDVVFVGTQTRQAAAALIRESALLLIPSHSETFGLVALEAAASGTPVIASNSTGTGSSVSHLSTGMLLPSREPAVWGRAIDALLSDPAGLASLSASAARHAELHTWRLTAELTVEAYRRALRL
ncbi:glycosyltransferase family 1 protein [Subtercola sp. Z020]|uniref:glycosyltransferase n=1 Tax=Subtercola sp. Z020 TaxID=2080582 RepID=UPI000CE732A3|nr:glycosyltransferase [Subtercola sp. Z020]PPF79716.1 glycosyltransferase family 1 protein [Subtercola sp. Z020]